MEPVHAEVAAAPAGAYYLVLTHSHALDMAVSHAILERGEVGSLARYTDPLPQALVLTAIVIGFATTALLLVVLLAARGLTGTDHVDGRERER